MVGQFPVHFLVQGFLRPVIVGDGGAVHDNRGVDRQPGVVLGIARSGGKVFDVFFALFCPELTDELTLAGDAAVCGFQLDLDAAFQKILAQFQEMLVCFPLDLEFLSEAVFDGD